MFHLIEREESKSNWKLIAQTFFPQKINQFSNQTSKGTNNKARLLQTAFLPGIDPQA
jgi:hypothetical protein